MPVCCTAKPTADSFSAWIGGAMPGESFEYHRGFLACDRNPEERALTPAERRRVDALADQTRAMAAVGLVCLTQRRFGTADYSYLAIKASPRRAA
ncbi:hypothetical protein CCP1ISM_1120004 [Azospirillaceae bacterium]